MAKVTDESQRFGTPMDRAHIHPPLWFECNSMLYLGMEWIENKNGKSVLHCVAFDQYYGTIKSDFSENSDLRVSFIKDDNVSIIYGYGGNQ